MIFKMVLSLGYSWAHLYPITPVLLLPPVPTSSNCHHCAVRERQACCPPCLLGVFDVKRTACLCILTICASLDPTSACLKEGGHHMPAVCGLGGSTISRKGQLHEASEPHILHHRERLIIQDNYFSNASSGDILDAIG